MYTKKEIKKVYNLHLDYLRADKKDEAEHFFTLYL
jgi:hypothetical protein